MTPPEARSDRDLLVRLEAKFDALTDNFDRIEKRMDGFNARLDATLKEIKEDLKTEYVTKHEVKVLRERLLELEEEIPKRYATWSRFEPVEEVHKDVAKRLRTLLISVGVCILIAAASAPTWISIYKNLIELKQVSK